MSSTPFGDQWWGSLGREHLPILVPDHFPAGGAAMRGLEQKVVDEFCRGRGVTPARYFLVGELLDSPDRQDGVEDVGAPVRSSALPIWDEAAQADLRDGRFPWASLAMHCSAERAAELMSGPSDPTADELLSVARWIVGHAQSTPDDPRGPFAAQLHRLRDSAGSEVWVIEYVLRVEDESYAHDYPGYLRATSTGFLDSPCASRDEAMRSLGGWVRPEDVPGDQASFWMERRPAPVRPEDCYRRRAGERTFHIFAGDQRDHHYVRFDIALCGWSPESAETVGRSASDALNPDLRWGVKSLCEACERAEAWLGETKGTDRLRWNLTHHLTSVTRAELPIVLPPDWRVAESLTEAEQKAAEELASGLWPRPMTRRRPGDKTYHCVPWERVEPSSIRPLDVALCGVSIGADSRHPPTSIGSGGLSERRSGYGRCEDCLTASAWLSESGRSLVSVERGELPVRVPDEYLARKRAAEEAEREVQREQEEARVASEQARLAALDWSFAKDLDLVYGTHLRYDGGSVLLPRDWLDELVAIRGLPGSTWGDAVAVLSESRLDELRDHISYQLEAAGLTADVDIADIPEGLRIPDIDFEACEWPEYPDEALMQWSLLGTALGEYVTEGSGGLRGEFGLIDDSNLDELLEALEAAGAECEWDDELVRSAYGG